MLSQKALKATILVFAFSLALRLVWATFATVTPVSDFHGYDVLAWKWLTTGNFGVEGRWAYRTPGYPGFLALTYAIFGHSWKAAALVQALLGAATSALLVILAGKAVSLRASVIAGLLHALSPTALAYVPVLASENVAVPLVVAGLLCLAAGSLSSPWRHLAVGVAGVLFGLLLLVRPAAMFFLPAWLLLAVWRPPARSLRMTPGATFLAATAIVLTPWLVRNYRVGLGPATLSTTGSVNLYMGNNSLASEGGYLRRAQTLTELPEREQDQKYRAAALAWMRDNPLRYLALCGTRACRLVGTPPDGFAASYLTPTADNDAANLAARRASDGKSAPGELVDRGRAVIARNAKGLERFRRLSAPLTLVALLLSLLRWRSFAIVLIPALCYAAGLSLTYSAERFRELWNPLVFVPLAALLADLLFATEDLSPRLRRATKATVALTAVAASFFASAACLDNGWYKLAPYRLTAPDASRCNSSPVALEGSAEQHRSRWKCGSDHVGIRCEQTALRCEIEGGSGVSHGGVRFWTGPIEALRLELSFLNLPNVESGFVDGYDGHGCGAEKTDASAGNGA